MARSHNFTKRNDSNQGTKQDDIEPSGRTGFSESKINQDALNAYLQSESPYKSPEHDQPNYDVLQSSNADMAITDTLENDRVMPYNTMSLVFTHGTGTVEERTKDQTTSDKFTNESVKIAVKQMNSS